MPDIELERLIAVLRKMPLTRRNRVIGRLAPAERIQLEQSLTPAGDPQERLSKPLAEVIEALRDGPVPSVTAKAGAALLAAAAQSGSKGMSHQLDRWTERPSLLRRLMLALTGKQA